MSWMTKNTGITAPTRTANAQSASGSGFKDGDRANVRIERISRKPSDNAQVVQQHGEDGADNAISIMHRVKETADGKNVKRCLFQTLYIMSSNPTRAAQDAQYLAALCTLADENHGGDGLYEEIIEGAEFPDDELLKDLIGTDSGVSVGVFLPKDAKPGQGASEFVRALKAPYDFAETQTADAGGVSGSARSERRRNRG